MSVSVLIATFNRAGLLDDCLTCLGRQPFAPGDEVIVVDNGSTDDTQAVVSRHRTVFPVPLRALLESRPGKSHALAAALAAAEGHVLAFIDDDVNVDAGWLTAIRHTLATREHERQVDMVGGPVLPRWQSKPPRWLRMKEDEYGRLAAPLALLNFGAVPSPLGERTLLGANFAVRRSVVDRIGGFAPHLGKLRGTLLSGEDSDFCRRVQAAGFTAIYSPTPTVRHWVPTTRMRIGYFLHWFYWSGITNAALDRAAGIAGRQAFGVPAYLFKRGAIGLLRTAAALLLGRSRQALDAAIDVAFTLGYTAKCWKLVALEAERRLSPGEAV